MKCKDPLHSVQVCWHANMDIKNICNLGPIKPQKGPKWRRTNLNIALSKASLSLWVQKSAQSDNINAMQSYTSWGNKKYFCCNITGCVPCNYVLKADAEQLWVNRLQKMVMLMTQTQMLSQSVEMETLDLEKYLLYLCELEFVFCNVQCNVEVVGGCNFSSNVLNAPQGCAGGFLSLLNTLATSSSPCDASQIFRRKPFCEWCNLLLFSGQMQV